MSDHRFTPRALLDLEEIVDFLVTENPKATTTVEAIEERCRALAAMPDSGRSREDLAPGLRSAVVDPYLIFYRSVGDQIQIIRVLHGRRDIGSIFRRMRR
jgi:toxin ParE1/3/4